MRYLVWLGRADAHAVPIVSVSPTNVITVTYAAPTKRATIVQLPNFAGPAKVIADGTAEVAPPPSADVPIVGRPSIQPATGPPPVVFSDK